MKATILQAIALFFFHFAIAQQVSVETGETTHPPVFRAGGSLSGKVTDSAGQAVPGASVYISDLKIGAIADGSGSYHFNTLPAGSYLIEAHAVGYATATKTVRVAGVTSADFKLSAQYTEESPVVITGLSKATQVKRSPVPIVAVSHKVLTENLSSNIIDAISKVPGVSALSTGPNVSKPFIRGLGYNRILTLYDGVRQEGQQWGDEHGIEVDQYGVDRVEIIKGPASLTYGSDALAGVVNLIPTAPAPEGKIIGDVTAEYQTNNGMFGGSGMIAGTKNGFEWMGRVSHKEATNYRNKIDGRVFGTSFQENDASVSLGLHGAFGYSHLSLSMFDDLQEIPDGSRDSASRRFTKQVTEDDLFRPEVTNSELKSYAMTPLHQHVQHYRAYSNNNFNLGKGRLVVDLGFQRSVRREFSHPEMSDVAGLYLQLNSYMYDVKYYFPEWSGWQLSAGINGMYQQNKVTSGTEFIIPSYRQFDLGPFAMIKKNFDKLDLSAGLRYDSRSFNNDALYTGTNAATGFDQAVTGSDTAGTAMTFSKYHHVFSGMSGSVGLTYAFSDHWSAKANISRGYRSPNISEISANGVHPGTGIYQLGNENFKPEFSLQEDVGVSYTSRFVRFEISAFYNSLDHYIYNEKLLGVGGRDSIRDGNTVYAFQQGKANLYGGEVSLDIHPVKQIHFENSLSLVYGNRSSSAGKVSTDSNKYLPFIPPVHGLSELRFEFGGKKYEDAFVKVQAAWYASQNRVYLEDNTETPTPGYTLVNAGIGTGLKNGKDRKWVNIYFMVNNVFDVAYQDHLSRLKYFEEYPNDPRGHHGIYGLGRNFSLKLDFPF